MTVATRTVPSSSEDQERPSVLRGQTYGSLVFIQSCYIKQRQTFKQTVLIWSGLILRNCIMGKHVSVQKWRRFQNNLRRTVKYIQHWKLVKPQQATDNSNRFVFFLRWIFGSWLHLDANWQKKQQLASTCPCWIAQRRDWQLQHDVRLCWPKSWASLISCHQHHG